MRFYEVCDFQILGYLFNLRDVTVTLKGNITY